MAHAASAPVLLGLLLLLLCANGALAECSFRALFDRNDIGPGIHKWLHYFPAYEREFGQWCRTEGANPRIRMLEIGVQSGGSLNMWRQAFGKNLALVVGVDVNPEARTLASVGHNLHVVIGDQSDSDLWRNLSSKYGSFDIILDDGSHKPWDIVESFNHGFQLIRPGGVYFIEDLNQGNLDSVYEILMYKSKIQPNATNATRLFDQMHNMSENTGNNIFCCKSCGSCTPANWAQTTIEYITIYPMILAIRKRLDVDDWQGGSQGVASQYFLRAVKHGTRWIPKMGAP